VAGEDLAAGGVVPAEWDGPIVHLDWRGTSYSTAGATFVADRVISPGDLVHRTLTIVNDGPAAAVLTVLIQADQHLPEVARNPELAKDVVLFWDAAGVEGSESFSGLLARASAESGAPVPVAQVQVAQGETVPVTVGFRFGADVADHRMVGADSTMISFDVLAQLHGDTAAPQPELPRVLPRVLPRTGAAALGWAAVAGALLVSGWLLVAAARRRRRCDDCERRLGRDDRWNEYHLGHGRVHTRCVPCWEELGDLDRAAVGVPDRAAVGVLDRAAVGVLDRAVVSRRQAGR
jgi:LPXTG-motif cell wall-anchored protein